LRRGGVIDTPRAVGYTDPDIVLNYLGCLSPDIPAQTRGAAPPSSGM